MLRPTFTNFRLWLDHIWKINVFPLFQSKRVRITHRIRSIVREEFVKEQIVDPRQLDRILYETNLENKIPFEFASELEIDASPFAGGKKKLKMKQKLHSSFSKQIRYQLWKLLKKFLYTFQKKSWKDFFSKSDSKELQISPDLLSAASPNPYRLYLHSLIFWEEIFPWEEWKSSLPISWIPFGSSKKIKLRFIAARASSFSKQEFYEESYSPELAFCDLYALGYLRETSDKNVDLENPESYYLGTFFPSKLERNNLPLWLKERRLFPDEFQWKSSSKEQVFKIFRKEIRFRIEREAEDSMESQFIQVGGKKLLLKSEFLEGKFFQRAILTYHPMVFASRIFKEF
ncbi:hypothetical protein QMM61_02435 [Leptospira santarosai]|uniref:hypothetical protein n=1 Tax=Leptospira santarosai TaxID=28183 RepID=UPI0024AEBD96|nr:hypothetical protein [Leptospira santarosai]MDI7195566.1 hypothetical protein [Leptospira santarosai]